MIHPLSKVEIFHEYENGVNKIYALYFPETKTLFDVNHLIFTLNTQWTATGQSRQKMKCIHLSRSQCSQVKQIHIIQQQVAIQYKELGMEVDLIDDALVGESNLSVESKIQCLFQKGEVERYFTIPSHQLSISYCHRPKNFHEWYRREPRQNKFTVSSEMVERIKRYRQKYKDTSELNAQLIKLRNQLCEDVQCMLAVPVMQKVP